MTVAHNHGSLSHLLEHLMIVGALLLILSALGFFLMLLGWKLITEASYLFDGF